MRKLLMLGTLVTALGITAMASAAPMYDFEPGNVNVTLGVNFTDNMRGDGVNAQGQQRAYGKIEAGWADRVILEAKLDEVKAEQINFKIHNNQVNVKYQAVPELLNVVVGYNNASSYAEGIGWNTHNSMIGGIEMRKDLGKGYSVWGSALGGKNYKSFEIGASKELVKNLDLDISYVSMKNLNTIAATGMDVKSEMIKTGLAFRF